MILPNIRINGHFDGHDDGQRLAEACQVIFNPLADISICRLTPEGNLMGGVLYNSYSGRGGSINMHYAGFHPRWFSRDMLWVCYDYPFNQLGVKKVFGQVPSNNEKAIKVNLHMGFRPERLIKDVFPDSDMLLMAMYREDCRYLTMIPPALKEKKDGRQG